MAFVSAKIPMAHRRRTLSTRTRSHSITEDPVLTPTLGSDASITSSHQTPDLVLVLFFRSHLSPMGTLNHVSTRQAEDPESSSSVGEGRSVGLDTPQLFHCSSCGFSNLSEWLCAVSIGEPAFPRWFKLPEPEDPANLDSGVDKSACTMPSRCGKTDVTCICRARCSIEYSTMAACTRAMWV